MQHNIVMQFIGSQTKSVPTADLYATTWCLKVHLLDNIVQILVVI